MSTPAWSALADRFAALAAEQEFRFTTHPFDRPGAFQDDAERFRLAYAFGGSPGAPASVGIVLGQGAFQRGEFVRINRFRWLSWSAGLLLGHDPCWPPETHWWRHLREACQAYIETDGTGRTTLPSLAQFSAEAARRLAASPGSTAPALLSAKADNWPAIQASLHLFRERFNAERWHTARPQVALVAFPDYTIFDAWKRRTIDPAAPNPTEPRPFAAHGTVWGEPDAVKGFVDLATDAGTALPLELSFAPPIFPWFNSVANMHPSPRSSWLEFLYLVCPASFTLEEDFPVPDSRVALLNTSAFTTSAAALDRVQRLDGQAFIREFRLTAVRLNPWFTESDQIAALAAVEAAMSKENRRADAPKTLHWTEYPETVEKFGDLFSIHETLHEHRDFDFECFPDDPERPAYSVDLKRGEWTVTPRPERMPGLERLLERLEREGHDALTLPLMRELRRRTTNALKCDRSRVNAMTLDEVADVLDAADRNASGSSEMSCGESSTASTSRGLGAETRANERIPPSGGLRLQRHLTFQRLLTRFEEAARRFPSFQMYAVKLGAELALPWVLDENCGYGQAIAGGRVGWIAAAGDEREAVYLNGLIEPTDQRLALHLVASAITGPGASMPPPENALRLYYQLATEAGAALPAGKYLEEYLRPVCPFTIQPLLELDAASKWSLFVFNVLRAAGGLQFCLVENEIQRRRPRKPGPPDEAPGDEPPKRATYAFLTPGPFAASVRAIECTGLMTEAAWDALFAGASGTQREGDHSSPSESTPEGTAQPKRSVPQGPAYHRYHRRGRGKGIT